MAANAFSLSPDCLAPQMYPSVCDHLILSKFIIKKTYLKEVSHLFFDIRLSVGLLDFPLQRSDPGLQSLDLILNLFYGGFGCFFQHVSVVCEVDQLFVLAFGLLKESK